MRRIVLPFLICALGAGTAGSQTVDMQTLGRFAIDRHEVSVEQFAEFAKATGVTTAAEAAGGGSTYEGGWVVRKGWTWRSPFGLPARGGEPAVHINYREAQAFCRWAGKRLPTDAEWMEAAYTERRVRPPPGFTTGQTYPYPTGSTPTGANCLGECGVTATRSEYAAPTVTTRGAGHALVGTTRPGVNGLWDMGGNVWEWTDNGAQDAANTARPNRGGSWWYGAAQMHRDHLQTKPADTSVVYVGFRCAKSLP